MRSPRLLAAAAAASMLVLAACGTTGSSSAPTGPPEAKPVTEITIGFSQKQMDAPYFAAMEAIAAQRAQQQGFRLLFQNAGGDPVNQLSQVQAMLSQGVDALVINAISPETQRTQLEQAAGQVPLMFVDTSIPDVGITAVQSDNREIGRLSGLLTAARFGTGTAIDVAVLNGGPLDELVGPARQEGFLAGLTEGGVPFEIVAAAAADYTQEQAVSATESMLAANPDVDLVLGLNDSMALGALSVLRNQGNTTTLVAGAADGQKEALAEISTGGCTGQYVSTGLNSPGLATEQVFDIAVGVATGEIDPATVERTSLTTAAGIGCDNVAEYYDASSVF